MVQTISGRGSVPAHAFPVEVEGKSYVDWGEVWVDPDEGPVLLEFASLAGFGQEEAGAAVARFVQRFGTLALCKEHVRCFHTWDHGDCERLKPEPVDLWLEHARTVAWVLKAKADLEAGREPFEMLAPEPGDRGLGGALKERWSLKAELLGREERASGKQRSREQRAALYQLVMGLVADAEEESADELRELDAQLEVLRKTHEPRTPEKTRKLIHSKVDNGLYHFPVTLRLEADPQTPMGLRPILQATSSVLSDVYLELAWEVSGSGSVAFCSECGHPYQPKRKPKRNQANFCSECRKGSAPQRLHMRKKRAKG